MGSRSCKERGETTGPGAARPDSGECVWCFSGSRDFAWRSTGLYLSPKTSAIFTFPASVTSAGLQVQIGCHTDNLIECNPVCRPPVVTQKLHVTKEKLTVSSLLGGLIYIYLPPKAKLGKFNVKIESAKRAPFYQKGKTEVSEWLKTIRHYPAPWAEFAAENIILTVPSDVASSVEDPEDLLRFWDDIMAAVAELAAIPNVSRPERIVADVQIAFGFMHSGYPIMINTTSAPSFVNLKKMKTEGFWGAIHELGHNQEKEAWMFRPHTNEAINNLWSVYVHEKLCNIPRHTAHHQLQPEKRKERIKTYVKEGAKLEKWAVFTALETYLQLQEGFGWEPFIQLFSDYQTTKMRSNENPYKMNMWAEKFSLQVKKNLVPFFKMWGWPIKDEVSQKLSTLPEWEGNPMKQYVTA
ncbi:TRPM8 channel-associated factor homolog [Ascaphus truei]|uniref:TRPM8 channel-associated factor homolog n=1 Tax=Ascaphus truei TaxID=8439 RepID=UPI003F5A5683